MRTLNRNTKLFVMAAITCMMAFIISFIIAYCCVSSGVLPLFIGNKYIGSDGEEHYIINVTGYLNTITIGVDGDNTAGTGTGNTDINSVTPASGRYKSWKQTSAELKDKAIAGSVTIGGAGCGLCSFASMMYAAGYEMTPDKWLEYMDSKGQPIRHYWSGGSMDWDFPANIATKLNAVGEFGTWSLTGSKTGGPIPNSEFESFVKQHLSAGDFIMMSTSPGLFTTGGHIIMCVGYYDSSGSSMRICDSSGRCAANLGITWEQAQEVAFPINSTSGVNGSSRQGNNEQSYRVKAMWAFHHS